MKQRNISKGNPALAEKYQLWDIVWAVKLSVSRLRAKAAVRVIRNQACRDGLNKMTLKEVKTLIKRTRVEQKRDKQL